MRVGIRPASELPGGRVTGDQQVTIDFTTAQLNDVLQSLTAIDLNGGRIAGAGYNSTTPLAEQLSSIMQPKLVEVGWSTGGLDDSALAEYIVLMLVNGKTQEQIASELSNDLLNLGPDDSGALDFSSWLFSATPQMAQRSRSSSLLKTRTRLRKQYHHIQISNGAEHHEGEADNLESRELRMRTWAMLWMVFTMETCELGVSIPAEPF